MKYKTIVNFIDDHNEGGVVLAKDFCASKVVLVCSKNNKKDIERLNNIYKKVIGNVEIELVEVTKGNPIEIRNLIKTYSSKDTVFNVTGGERINSLLMLQMVREMKQDCAYIDVLSKKLYILNDEIKITKEQIIDLEIKDLAEAAGANIIVESSELTRKKDIIEITKKIQANLDVWHKYKQRLYDNSTFSHDYKDSKLVTVHKYKLLKEELILVRKCLAFLQEVKGITIDENDNEIKVTFLNNYLKGFVFKSGTWLEVFTNIIINEITEIDEAKSGVLFFWNDDARMVKNEIDVVAIKDSILICISCKDSDRYDENALNELTIYAKKLGGEDAKKVLVATKKPLKTSLNERAKQMGITLIILDKDINKFRQELKVALK